MADRVVLAPINHHHLHHHPLHHLNPHNHHHHHHHHHYAPPPSSTTSSSSSTNMHHSSSLLSSSSSRKRKQVKRLSSASQLIASSNAAAYYPTAFITNPCDQLFGPSQPLFDYDQDENATTKMSSKTSEAVAAAPAAATAASNTSLLSSSGGDGETVPDHVVSSTTATATNHNETSTTLDEAESRECEVGGGDANGSGVDRFDYIPAPKWTKIQNSILEELFKNSRYPKSNELKSLAQRFHVMDSDIEEWFRKRRGRDRKIKRKNEVLKNLIDCYIDK